MSLNQSLFDLHELIHEVPALVASSSLDSSSSIGTGSPTSLIPESLPHDVRSSLSSSHNLSHNTPTVKFAPLPPIDPSRKRSLAPLGASARSRRKRVIQQEGGSILWPRDDVPEEDMEDPIVMFAKFVKRTGKTLWRRVRQRSKAVPQEKVSYSAEPILDIIDRPTVHPSDMALGEEGLRVPEVVGEEDKQGRRASWSPSAGRGTPSRDEAKRRSTSDLPHSLIP
ncbi:hypothetical protein J3R83DRAFT_4799 [Lanmaoa asiatica]|nr:hypothetical protein J3R83DRAFT_4799 [Lanmaoa asiatica]